jgi:hypothetical protein
MTNKRSPNWQNQHNGIWQWVKRLSPVVDCNFLGKTWSSARDGIVSLIGVDGRKKPQDIPVSFQDVETAS